RIIISCINSPQYPLAKEFLNAISLIVNSTYFILFLSHPKYHKKNIESMINILLMNGYPLDTIFSTINNKIKKLSSRKNLYKNNIDNNNESIELNRKKYVCQTKRKAKTRIKEHKANIKKSKDSLTVLSQHQIDCGHKINWDDIQILDIEPFFQKRITSEMIFIKKQINGLNKQSDTKITRDFFRCLA
ncbi:hypothetical protein ALC60_03025, partial [Trachymyrmex zeteki]